MRKTSLARVLRALKAKEYQRSAWTFQHYEATLIIGIIATRIMKEQPHLPLYTIHDSFLTVPQHVPYVQDVTRDEFNRLGIHPSLHTETYQ